MTAKQWLSRGYDIDKEINALLLAQVRLRASMMHVTPAYSGDVRVQTSIVRGDQTETAIDRLTELEKRINERIDSLTAVKAEILSAIAKVGNQRCGRFSQKDMSISRRGRISQQGCITTQTMCASICIRWRCRRLAKSFFELPVFTRSTCGNMIPSKGRQGKAAFSFWEDITMGSMIKWIQTPKSCRECECWDKKMKTCRLKVCRFPAKR